MSRIKSYLSLIKFSHTIFAMPFALVGFFLAIPKVKVTNDVGQWNLNKTVGWGELKDDVGGFEEFKQLNPGLVLFVLVILCMIFARSAAMAFNRYLDRKFDEKNPRTAIREIPAGVINAKSALLFTIVCSLLFVVSNQYFISLRKLSKISVL